MTKTQDSNPAALVYRLLTERRPMPRVIGIGEPVHGVKAFPRVRNEVFEHLVEHAGFQTIALESDAWAGRLVDAWVRRTPGCEGLTEDEVLANGFSHGFGASPANRELLRWARTRNAGLPTADQVRVTGFDGPMEMVATPSPRATLLHLYDYLSGRDLDRALPCDRDTLTRLLGADEPWVEPMAMLDPSRSVGGEQRVRDVRLLADDLTRTLEAEAPALRRAGDPGLEDAELAARTATGLLAHHAAMARPSDDRAGLLCALRDTMMADNVAALARRTPVLLFAHHQHLRTGTSTMAWGGVRIAGVDVPPTTLRWQPAGAHLATRLGDRYAVVAMAVGRAEEHGIGEPDPSTAESALAARPPDRRLVAGQELRDLRTGRAARATSHPGYFTRDDDLLDELDAVLFLRDAD